MGNVKKSRKGGSILCKVTRKSLTEKMTLEKRPKKGDKGATRLTWNLTAFCGEV